MEDAWSGTEAENFVEGGENIIIDKKKNNNYIQIQKRSYEGSYYFSTQLIKLFCIYFFSCHVLEISFFIIYYIYC
jgi:hypothetical protein